MSPRLLVCAAAASLLLATTGCSPSLLLGWTVGPPGVVATKARTHECVGKVDGTDVVIGIVIEGSQLVVRPGT